MEKGQLDGAIEDLREAIIGRAESAPLLQELLANVLERAGTVELAERHHADALRASQFNPDVGLEYAGFLQRRGNDVRREQVLIELANRNPDNIPVWTALGEVKLLSRDWSGAQAVADRIKQIGDRSGIADQIRGQALRGANNNHESIQVFQAAFRAAPTGVRPLANLVRSYLQAQNHYEAETFLKGVLTANPANAEAYVLLGSVQLVKNEPEQALRSVKSAIEKQPRNPVGYIALAELCLRRNDTDCALGAIRDGLKEVSDNFQMQLFKATVLEMRKDYDGAIAEYEGMLVQQPNALIVVNNLASLLSEHRSDHNGLERAQALGVMLRSSGVPAFKDTLGWLSYQRGDYLTATKLLEEAVEAMPRQVMVRYHLGMSYLKFGQAEKAREQLQNAAELNKSDGVLAERIRAALKGD